jgi:hypothetical protein
VAIFAEQFCGGGLTQFSADQMSAGFITGGLNSTQAGNIAGRAFMTSQAINVY